MVIFLSTMQKKRAGNGSLCRQERKLAIQQSQFEAVCKCNPRDMERNDRSFRRDSTQSRCFVKDGTPVVSPAGVGVSFLESP